MTELMNIVENLVAMEIENKMNSKVEGRRNWLIRTEVMNGVKYIMFCGGYGEGDRRGWLAPEMIANIGKYSIRWYTYTYKKDYLEAVKMLKENGYKEFYANW